MAGQSSAILKGFDYQHLLSWYHTLSLKSGRDIASIKLENARAGYVDDLTVERKDGSVDFYQIKYHVAVGHYSMPDLLAATEGNSLMEKFWITWNQLITQLPQSKIRLILYSNWVYHVDDTILKCINGDDGHLGEMFFTAGSRTKCGKQRQLWKKAHNATDQRFDEFTRAISFQLGRNFTNEIKQMIADRMQLCGLKDDENAMLIAVGIVKDWIKGKSESITLTNLEGKIQKHDLYAQAKEKAASVYFVTVKNRKFDLPPDYLLDWRHYFRDVSGMGGHELIDGANWSESLLPELHLLEEQINSEVTPTLIRARGFARLSPWFAFGYTFSEVAGYAIEVNQQDKLWRTDEVPDDNFKVISENGEGEILSKENKVVAVGISITGSLEADVRNHINLHGGVDALLLLRPAADLGPGCFQSAGHVTAFSKQVKIHIRAFVKAHQADKLMLFYFGPLSGACFLGHRLNAVCNKIQIMESNPDGGYSESFIF